MKKFLFIFLSLFFVSRLYAQELKLIQGFNLSTYEIQPDVWGYDVGREVTLITANREGLLLGFGIEFSVSDNFAIEIQGLYFQKGCLIKERELYFGFLKYYTLNVVSLPILLKITPLSKLPVYVLGGGEVSLILTHKENAVGIMEFTKGYDYGFIIGGGFEVKILSRAFFIEGRYHQGLQNIIIADGIYFFESIKTKAFVLILGLKI